MCGLLSTSSCSSSDLSPLKLLIHSDIPSTCSGAEASAAPSSSRFVSPKKDLESYQKGYNPKKTSINTSWATRNFKDWVLACNSRHPENPCPEDILLTDNAKDLSFWLQKFIMGTRKKKREKYPPKTLYFILCWLIRYITEQKEVALNIFNKISTSCAILVMQEFVQRVLVPSLKQRSLQHEKRRKAEYQYLKRLTQCSVFSQW